MSIIDNINSEKRPDPSNITLKGFLGKYLRLKYILIFNYLICIINDNFIKFEV